MLEALLHVPAIDPIVAGIGALERGTGLLGLAARLFDVDLLGTHLGPLAGTEPTGRTFRSRMCALFVFEAGGDGIVCERVYFDSATILAQLAG